MPNISDRALSAAPRRTRATAAPLAVLAVVVLPVLTACAAAGSSSSPKVDTAGGRVTSAPHSGVGTNVSADAASGSGNAASSRAGRYGRPAAGLMAQVPGCDHPPTLAPQVLASIASLRGRPALIATVATASRCELRGQGVVVLAFANATSQASAMTQLSSFDGYFSDGIGWAAVPTTTAVPVSGLSSVQEVAATLGGSIGIGSGHG